VPRFWSRQAGWCATSGRVEVPALTLDQFRSHGLTILSARDQDVRCAPGLSDTDPQVFGNGRNPVDQVLSSVTRKSNRADAETSTPKSQPAASRGSSHLIDKLLCSLSETTPFNDDIRKGIAIIGLLRTGLQSRQSGNQSERKGHQHLP